MRVRVFNLAELSRQRSKLNQPDVKQPDVVHQEEAPGELHGVDSGSSGGLPDVPNREEPARRRRGRPRKR